VRNLHARRPFQQEADERAAKAAIHATESRWRPHAGLEEAWIIHPLVQDDGMSRVEVAKLLGRHKSWVCRRLALIERFGSQGQGRSTGGLLSPTAPRQIVRLLEGNQTEVLEAIRRERLTTAELAGWWIFGSAVLPNSVSRSTSCGIRAKPYRKPKERCPQRTILV
jgi:hypothetical protein